MNNSKGKESKPRKRINSKQNGKDMASIIDNYMNSQ